MIVNDLINDYVCFDHGSSGGPTYDTQVIRNRAGAPKRLPRKDMAARRWELLSGTDNRETKRAMARFFMARRGGSVGFLFEDWTDQTSNTDGKSAPTDRDQELGIGDDNTTEFQLFRDYPNQFRTERYSVTRPKDATVVISLDGVPLAASEFSVNLTTGIVTFNTAPAINVQIRVGFEFYFPVRFDYDGDDFLAIRSDDDLVESLSNLVIEEIPFEGVNSEEFFQGGARDFGSVTANFTVTPLDGYLLRAAINAPGLKVDLENVAGLSATGRYHVFENYGTQSLSIQSNGASIGTLAAGAWTDIFVEIDPGGNRRWSMFG